MSEETTAEVVSLEDEQKQRRLEELEHQVVHGLCETAMAIAEIHREELYEAAGYESFVAYCDDRLQRKRSMAYSILSAGQVFPLLDSAIADKIRSESLFRPLSGMKPENQAKVLTRAVAVADKQGLRLTAGIVEDVAEKNFGWLPKSKRAQQRKQAQDPDAESAKRREALYLGLEAIVGIGLGGYDAVQEFGDPYEWPNFTQARQFLNDAADAADD